MNDKKVIKILVAPEVHSEIKVKAFQSGLTMTKYITECVRMMGSTFLSSEGAFTVKQPSKETKLDSTGFPQNVDISKEDYVKKAKRQKPKEFGYPKSKSMN